MLVQAENLENGQNSQNAPSEGAGHDALVVVQASHWSKAKIIDAMISYIISYIISRVISYMISQAYSLYMGRMGPMLDVRGIDVQKDRNRNCSGSYTDSGQFKSQESIGIAAEYPVAIRISAELEPKMLMPRHALVG